MQVTEQSCRFLMNKKCAIFKSWHKATSYRYFTTCYMSRLSWHPYYARLEYIIIVICSLNCNLMYVRLVNFYICIILVPAFCFCYKIITINLVKVIILCSICIVIIMIKIYYIAIIVDHYVLCTYLHYP